MKLISLKMPKLKADEKITAIPEPNSTDRYPWGFRITFESEQVDKLPYLQEAGIGEKLEIGAIGEIISIRMNEELGGKKRYTVEVQLQQVGCQGHEERRPTMIDQIKRAKRGGLEYAGHSRGRLNQIMPKQVYTPVVMPEDE